MVGTRRSSRTTRGNPLPTPSEKKALSAPSEESTPSSGNQVPTPLSMSDEEDVKPVRGKRRVKAEPESESEEDQPLAKTAARGKGKGKAKAISISSSDDDDDEGSDFVLSEEDVKPAPSSVNRAAILRAAERRMNGSSSSSALPTPGASGTSTPLADKIWDGSESEAEESDFLSDLSDSPAPKKKGKGKAKASKGRRLDGGESEDLPEAWKGKKRKSRREKDEENAEKAEIKKMERKLAAELGRKLTQGEKNQIRLQRDAWGDLEANLEPVKPVPMEAHPSLKLTLLPFQKESLYWMKKQEEGPWKGGMLADEMGMGKTKIDLKKYDVVLCSYGTLEASFRRQQRGFKRGNLMITEPSPMHAFEWFRVILDEAHNIKERTTNAAKAAFALKAKYRWCLSGTPLQNRVGELYSLVRFLGADPFRRHCDDCGHKPMDHVSFWNSEILTPIVRYGIEPGNPGHTAFKKLKILLDRMMLRLSVPTTLVFLRAPSSFAVTTSRLPRRNLSWPGLRYKLTLDYSNIFSLITRMRQMACHPDLVLKSQTSSLAQPTTEGSICRICNDSAEDAIVSQCHHVFDRECIKQYLEMQQLRGHNEAIDLSETNAKRARQGILSRLDVDKWRSSSKLEALVDELEKLRKQDCTIKSLVLLGGVRITNRQICRLEGGMTPQQRDATIQHFMKNTQVTVFLISLKAGGVALNLTEASRVFMMDSWWNPSVENQAGDRIHRLGQKRAVTITKFVVEDSIEDQIVKLQAKKLAMTDAALSRDPDAALGKLTVEDLGFLFKM
ncbi:hypothetical protein A1Q1_07710 [Trichosporon asahii var. asahii CBS 2479]|uniref:DNA repair protein rad16 n=1 Tax=Trichosporon asahii var. asahii (strain ATCC 90039 / CBS 2479 / JCM 2466 / KCTC 7840 / NBRC 103889/ NCYC 2677 / UAMH 7654) TaxID=1186058 RepID=J4UHN8_TRIAS|nr:hypothetical protein A1Q1_07710 [Trichosporon asahii var. asahii CBS 2479]EJT51115.1 hypothetical protein A1Q1_07710 [Trichosporon asahii var. asahii CBS 2479]